jgi:two-component system nitrogen regulation sensor histidine kinase GlnL
VGRKPVFNRVNVHEVIEEALSVLEQELNIGKITLRRSYDPSLPLIKGDEGKLLQVFINLIKNAREAMRSGGTLEVKTKPAYEYLIEKKKKVKMKFAVVSFTDTGTGIAFEDYERIFLPFYTSKKEGTGLGLTLSKKIILDHRGLIKIRTEPRKGTSVDVYLPFADSF